MSRLRIKYHAVTLLIFGLALSARAQGFAMVLLPEPDHDWTFRAGSYQFGVQGYRGWTRVCYGYGSNDFSVSFFPLVIGTGIGCLGLCGISAFVLKRKERDDAA